MPRVRSVPLAAATGLRNGQAPSREGGAGPRVAPPSHALMPSTVLAAAIQMTSTAEVERNLDTAERLVTAAAGRGAQLVGLPENFAFLRSEGQPVPEAQTLDGPWVRRMADLARRHRLTLLLGSHRP